MIGEYGYIGNNHQTSIQYDTSMFIGSKKLVDVWIACEPKMDITSNIKTENDWVHLYNYLLLENLFWNCCKSGNVKELLVDGLYACNYI